MRIVLVMGATALLSIASMGVVNTAAEAARCPQGQMYRPSRGICVSKGEFRSQLSGRHSYRSEKRVSRREARRAAREEAREAREEARLARVAVKKKADPSAMGIVTCETEACVARLEKLITNDGL